MSRPRVIVQTGIYGYGILGRRAEEDLPGTLGAIAAAGFDGLEVMSSLLAEPDRLARTCTGLGLHVDGVHLFWHELETFDWSVLTTLDTPRLILSGLPVASEEAIADNVPQLREHADRAAKAGARLLIHNHAEEGRPVEGGRIPLEILADRTQPAELGFVVDLHWAAVAGDTDRIVRATAGRCDYLHIKDGLVDDPEAPHSFDLGTGEVDLAHGWAAAGAAGAVAVAAVERSMPAEDLDAALRHDAAYTRGLIAAGGAGR
ncbi:sugar phosphate isomerase/epimerase family protein [Streptomyces sp. CA2R106]|uniref:sugar phosphate isomerase/epimerase family protein n=1 Tax=Streptomyces sp. CA2R106 TaxID=3120153 RepID=UPI0030092625